MLPSKLALLGRCQFRAELLAFGAVSDPGIGLETSFVRRG